MMDRLKFNTIDDYLASVSPEVKPILAEIRKLIHLKVPDAQEAISYQMPAFKQKRTFIYFIGLIKELQPYRNEKGNLSFPLDQAIPYKLIGRVAVALSKQYRGKTGS